MLASSAVMAGPMCHNARRCACPLKGGNNNNSTIYIVSLTELSRLALLVWLAQLVKALAAPTHVRSFVQEVRVRSLEQTSSTLASIPPG